MGIQSTINCPDCGSAIYLDSILLLSGKSFQCSNEACGVAISLSAADVEMVSKAFKEYENLKQKSVENAGSFQKQ